MQSHFIKYKILFDFVNFVCYVNYNTKVFVVIVFDYVFFI